MSKKKIWRTIIEMQSPEIESEIIKPLKYSGVFTVFLVPEPLFHYMFPDGRSDFLSSEQMRGMKHENSYRYFKA